jgi:hypothetical protein
MTQRIATDEPSGLPSNSNVEGRSAEVAEELARQSRIVSEKVRDRAVEAAERRKGGVSDELRRIGHKLESFEDEVEGSHELAPVVGYAARTALKAADALENRSAEQLIDMVKCEVRERPGIAITAMFALGFLGGRLLAK